MKLSPHARVIDAYLRTKDTDLETFLIRHRADGKSGHQIARELLVLTNGIVDLTPQTIYNWLRDLEDDEVVA
jgi:DNA-binding PadR family transcriptional regulator